MQLSLNNNNKRVSFDLFKHNVLDKSAKGERDIGRSCFLTYWKKEKRPFLAVAEAVSRLALDQWVAWLFYFTLEPLSRLLFTNQENKYMDLKHFPSLHSWRMEFSEVPVTHLQQDRGAKVLPSIMNCWVREQVPRKYIYTGCFWVWWGFPVCKHTVTESFPLEKMLEITKSNH